MKDIMKSHPILSSLILLNSEIAMLVGYIPMNNKTLTTAALLAAALLAGIFSVTTPMTVYAEDDYDDEEHDDDERYEDDEDDGKDHDYDDDGSRGGDSSETNTEQSIKQKNEGGVGSSQFNCGQNNIGEASAATVDVDLCGTLDIGVGGDDGPVAPGPVIPG
jgi:hypothetical protein